MKRYSRIVIVLWFAATLTACVTTRVDRTVNMVTYGTPAELNMIAECGTLFEAYGRYLQPHFPQDAEKYKKLSYQHAPTLILIESALASPNAMADLGTVKAVQQNAMKYDQRLTKWDNYLIKAEPEEITQQVTACNTSYAPRLATITQNLRADPKFSSLYHAMENASQKK